MVHGKGVGLLGSVRNENDQTTIRIRPPDFQMPLDFNEAFSISISCYVYALPKVNTVAVLLIWLLN